MSSQEAAQAQRTVRAGKRLTIRRTGMNARWRPGAPPYTRIAGIGRDPGLPGATLPPPSYGTASTNRLAHILIQDEGKRPGDQSVTPWAKP
jgi:hypothetical protein